VGPLKSMIILAIETSCDETAAAILKCSGKLKNPRFEILSNVVASQVKIHSQWGGVVPSLAKREHQKNLIPILIRTLKKASLLNSKSEARNSRPAFGGARFAREARRARLVPMDIGTAKFKILNSILKREPELLEKLLKFLREHQEPKIDVIAVTQGPGLEPALWVGINFAKALAIVWDKPLIAINHMEGHIASVLLKQNRGSTKHEARKIISNFEFPAVSLLASGGHTQLILINPPAGGWGEYKIIGETLDDAAGEAFDKVARMLGLGYPGGPAIATEAAKSKIRNPKHETNSKFNPPTGGQNSKFALPRPMLNSKDFNFSFSGLKTAVLYKIRDLPKEVRPQGGAKRRDEVEPQINEIRSLIAREFQQAVIDVLIKKTLRAAKEFKVKTIILGGGVAANKELRRQLKKAVSRENVKINDRKYLLKLLLPHIKFTGDNAAMIALAAYFHVKKKEFANWQTLRAQGNLRL